MNITEMIAFLPHRDLSKGQDLQDHAEDEALPGFSSQ